MKRKYEELYNNKMENLREELYSWRRPFLVNRPNRQTLHLITTHLPITHLPTNSFIHIICSHTKFYSSTSYIFISSIDPPCQY